MSTDETTLSYPIPCDEKQRLEMEAFAFRKLVQHFQSRTDVQNIDLMELSGFCRNCLSKWLAEGAEKTGIQLNKEQSREVVYGMPQKQWKTSYQKPRYATQNIQVKDLLANGVVGRPIKIHGWIKTKRDSKTFSFIELTDGSCLKGIQIIVDNTLENYDSDIKNLGLGSSVTVQGEIKASQGKGQRIEILANRIVVLGTSPTDYPLQKKGQSPEFLRSQSHLRARTNIIGSATRIRGASAQAIHHFFERNGFHYIHTPIITASDCEGAGEMFQVTTLDLSNPPKEEQNEHKIDYAQDFFARQSFLTVSGQLSAENLACALNRVYTFGPTFRAENSNTNRHASEFWMIEPELAFADLQADADLAEAFLKETISEVIEKCPEDVEFFEKIRKFKKPSPFIDPAGGSLLDSLQKVVEVPFIRITYTEAVEKLIASKKQFEFPLEWGVALQTEHERYLCEEMFNAPVIVTDYPRSFKAFYMYLNDDEKTVRAMDVLLPRVGEIIGGSQREDRYDVLLERIKAHHLDPKDYWWYLDLRKYGTVPHAGFGLGFERLVMYLTGLRNIRDVISFPRTPKHADF
jgi:asparaginyl-tRNA synthetase